MLIYAKMAKIWTFLAKNRSKFFFQKSPHTICRTPPRACLVQISAQNHKQCSQKEQDCAKKSNARKSQKREKIQFFAQILAVT